jgi:hypothetical protein
MATLSNRRLMLKETLKARFAMKKKPEPTTPQQQPVQISPRSFEKANPEDAF